MERGDFDNSNALVMSTNDSGGMTMANRNNNDANVENQAGWSEELSCSC